ncbi:BTAD domain-containing putative transcriptional regulator [Nocardioides sp.]|uniref:AfsR/SARP family transcriptional regulator n=1 Tax=Nocardioides sp. TaxID=35761 RepID=UPI001A1E8516|nr:BTAD domain-containing putative transcriptional regulator [Nocardioides sp.]MBJ7356854.1 winged helix-turn-helix domain-containing protein [Nocardioides sp.]
MFVRLLGPVASGIDPETPDVVTSHVQAAVLAHLAIADGSVLSWEALADRIWDEPPKSARNAVHVAVSKLRGLLEPEVLESTRSGYRLRTELLQVDARDADQRLVRARAMLGSGNHGGLLTTTERVLDAFGGEPLAGLVSQASARERARLEGLRHEAALLHAQSLVGLGRAGEAVQRLDHLVVTAALDERVHYWRMHALALDGRPNEAISAYHALRDILADELGTDPSGDAQSLYQRLLEGRSLPVTATRPQSRWRRSITLPPATHPVFGRAEDVREILDRLASGHRLVTLHGPGGIGKTTLAIAVADAWDAQHPPAWVADLSGCADRDQVLSAVSSVLGAPSAALEDVVDAVQASPSLVVLDNAEQIRAEVSELVGAVLAVKGTAVLVTSRLPLRRPDEHLHSVATLGASGPTSPALDMLRSAAPHQDLSALALLAERAEGVPLVLDLLSSALRWTSAEQLLAEVAGRRLGLVHDPSVVRPSRHQTFGDALGWSLERLSGGALAALRALTVLRGPYDLATARRVLAGVLTTDQSALVFAELVDLGLVQRVAGPGVPRFRILAPVRDVVVDVVGAPEAEVRRAHAAHFLGLVRELDEDPGALTGADTYVLAHDGDVTAALAWAWDDDRTSAMASLPPLLRAWLYRGGLQQRVDMWLGRASSEATTIPRVQAALAVCAAMSAVSNGDADGFAHSLDEVGAASEQLSDGWHDEYLSLRYWQCLDVKDEVGFERWQSRARPSAGPRYECSRRGAETYWRGYVRSDWGFVDRACTAEVGEEDVRRHPTLLVDRLALLGYARTALGRHDAAEEALDEAAVVEASADLPVHVPSRLNRVFLELARGCDREAVQLTGALLESAPWLVRNEPGLARIALPDRRALPDVPTRRGGRAGGVRHRPARRRREPGRLRAADLGRAGEASRATTAPGPP